MLKEIDHVVIGEDVIGPPMSQSYGPSLGLLPITVFVAANSFEPGEDPTVYIVTGTTVLVSALISIFAASIPRRIRFRRVRQREPEAIVMTIRTNASVADFLGSRDFGSGLKTLALSVSSEGISLWTGTREPSVVRQVPVTEVREVRSVSMRAHRQNMAGIAVRLADREFQFYLLGQRVLFSWPLGGKTCAAQAKLIRHRLNGDWFEGAL